MTRVLLLLLPLLLGLACDGAGQGLDILDQRPELITAPEDLGWIRPTDNPVLALEIASSNQIDAETSRRILEGTGLLRPGGSYQRALQDLRYTHTYMVIRNPRLTDRDKAWLFSDYQELRAALALHRDSPVMTRDHPDFSAWLDAAAGRLAHVKECERRNLLDQLLIKETSGRHWQDWVPIQSNRGATGFAQLLAATAKSVGVNRFDPAENLSGAASYLDSLIATQGLVGALAFYNGGTNPTPEKWSYARAIAARVQSCTHRLRPTNPGRPGPRRPA